MLFLFLSTGFRIGYYFMFSLWKHFFTKIKINSFDSKWQIQ